MLISVVAVFFILTRTRLGMRIRAGTSDLETVSVLGVNVRILRNLNFGLGIYLAGLAGVLAAGMLRLQPPIGSSLISSLALRVIEPPARKISSRRVVMPMPILLDSLTSGASPASSAARAFLSRREAAAIGEAALLRNSIVGDGVQVAPHSKHIGERVDA